MALAGKLKKAGWIIAGTVLLSALGLFYFSVISPSGEEYPLDTAQISDAPAADQTKAAVKQQRDEPLPLKSAPEADNRKETDVSLEDRLVKELKQLYSEVVFQKSTLSIFLKVKAFLTNLYPEDGHKRFVNVIKRAFPEQADQIMAALAKMGQYKRWLGENRHRLSQMNALEKQGFLWRKRKDLFGAAANNIWSEEVVAYENRKQEMRDAISLLDGSYDTTIEEKLDIYKSTLYQTYETSPEAYILENKGMLAQVFFGMDSVQKELRQMTPEHRQWNINQIRRDMGFKEAQVKELAERDAYRRRRWEKGLDYMQARKAIVEQYEGAQRKEQLDALRKKYFQHEAKTIKLEERDGFFRYERERIYGRN